MVGKRNSERANRAIDDVKAFKGVFPDLAAALDDWLEGGSFDDVEKAIENLGQEAVSTSDNNSTREERMIDIAAQLNNITIMKRQIDRVQNDLNRQSDDLKTSLLVTVAKAPTVPGFVKNLWLHMQSLGAVKNDLHPPSKNLANAMLKAARDYNVERIGLSTPCGIKIPPPITRWTDLPREFGGYMIVDVDGALDALKDRLSLPPSTKISYFTKNNEQPEVLASHSDTIRSWAKVIEGWAARCGEEPHSGRNTVWAFLLSHNWPTDPQMSNFFEGWEFDSPWTKGKFVRFERPS